MRSSPSRASATRQPTKRIQRVRKPAARHSAAAATKWGVVKLKGSPAQFMAVVEAPSAAAAIKKAIKEYDIADVQVQKRLAAYPWDGWR